MKIFVVILVVLLSSCYQKPHCYYQDFSSCEIITNGDKRYFTVMAKGQHYCCKALTFPNEDYSIEVIETTMIEWYEEMVNTKEGANCLLLDENCGPSWAYGQIFK